MSSTGNLKGNNDKINRTLDNVEKTTANLAAARIPETVASLQSTITQLNGLIGKLNSNSGTMGLLLNDKGLYQNLATTRSLNTLAGRCALHPNWICETSLFSPEAQDLAAVDGATPSDSVSKPVNK